MQKKYEHKSKYVKIENNYIYAEQQQAKPKLLSHLNIFWQYLLKIFADKPQLRVWNQIDHAGNSWWHVYDYATHYSASFGSKAQMLRWIKQFYLVNIK